MEPGRPAYCPWCGAIFVFGVRALAGEAPTDHDDQRFCSTGCFVEFREVRKMRTANNADDKALAKYLERSQRAARLVEMHCNSCVTTVSVNPAVDGTSCAACGLPLSHYGPFEAPPSVLDTAMRIVWR